MKWHNKERQALDPILFNSSFRNFQFLSSKLERFFRYVIITVPNVYTNVGTTQPYSGPHLGQASSLAEKYLAITNTLAYCG